MMWHVPQNVGVEDICTKPTSPTSAKPTRNAPNVRTKPNRPSSGKRPAMPPAARANGPSGPNPGIRGILGGPTRPVPEPAQDADGHDHVEPEHEQRELLDRD